MPPIYSSAHPFIHPPTHPPIYPLTHPFIPPPTRLSIHPPIHPGSPETIAQVIHWLRGQFSKAKPKDLLCSLAHGK